MLPHACDLAFTANLRTFAISSILPCFVTSFLKLAKRRCSLLSAHQLPSLQLYTDSMVMKTLFGKAGKAPATAMPTPVPSSATATATAATESMNEAREILEKREAHLLRLVQKEVESACAFQAANRQKQAIECIKRKRMHEAELERIANQKMNIFTTENKLHGLRLNTIVMESQAKGASAIEREITKNGGVDGIDALHDRMEDVLADGTEMLDASSRPMGEAASFEDAELLEELEAMELAAELQQTRTPASEAGSSSLAVPHTVPLVVPSGVPLAVAVPHARSSEERELAELTARMTMEQGMPMPMMAACF